MLHHIIQRRGPLSLGLAVGRRHAQLADRGPHSQTHSRSPSATSQAEDRTRPPLSNSSHLEVREEPRRHRRRTTSEGRSATDPIVVTQPPARVSARSQTDLSLRPITGASSAQPSYSSRPDISDGRSTSSPPTATTAQMDPNTTSLPFSARVSPITVTPPAITTATFESRTRRDGRPADLDLSLQANLGSSPIGHDSLVSPPLSSPGHQKKKSQFYMEPSITCSRCSREHIEYEVHYNCRICNKGNWNICLDCYRRGEGCLHWFGFGDTASHNWEKARRAGETSIARPHILTPCRYLPPRTIPGGADGRRVLTAEDPWQRLQSGTFCVRCLAWTNDCYWRCWTCNSGDWGYWQRLRQPGAMLYTSAPILDQQAIAGTDSTGEPSVSGTVSFCFGLHGFGRAGGVGGEFEQ